MPQLTVAVVGPGTVTSTPGDLQCPGTCNASYQPGSDVTLTATPSTDAVFMGWSHQCGVSATCTIPVDTDTNLQATFGRWLESINPFGDVAVLPGTAVRDQHGNLYVGGLTPASLIPGGPAVSDADFLAKLDPSGQLIWVVQSQGTLIRAVQDVAVCPDGTVVAVGDDYVLDTEEEEVLLRRYQPDSGVIWEDRYQVPGGVSSRAVVVDNACRIFMGGTAGKGGLDAGLEGYVQLREADGGVVWTQTIPAGLASVVESLALDGPNLFVAGYSVGGLRDGGASTWEDAFLELWHADGGVQWSSTIATPAAEQAEAVVVDGQHHIFVAGQRVDQTLDGQERDDGELWLARYEADAGAPIWTRNFGSDALDVTTAMAVAGDAPWLYVVGSERRGIPDGGTRPANKALQFVCGMGAMDRCERRDSPTASIHDATYTVVVGPGNTVTFVGTAFTATDGGSIYIDTLAVDGGVP